MNELIEIPIRVRPHWSGGKINGHYLWAKAFPLGVPNIDRRQFIGLCGRGYLVVTMGRPKDIDQILQINKDLPVIGQDESVTWVGTLGLYTTNQALQIYIPPQFWKPEAEAGVHLDGVGYGESVNSRTNRLYVLLHVPLIKPVI